VINRRDPTGRYINSNWTEPPPVLWCRCRWAQRRPRYISAFDVWQCDTCGHKTTDPDMANLD